MSRTCIMEYRGFPYKRRELWVEFVAFVAFVALSKESTRRGGKIIGFVKAIVIFPVGVILFT